MKRSGSSFIRFALFATLVVAVIVPGAAAAFPLRSPQVVFNNVALQNYLNSADGGINVTTDQLDGQQWVASVSGNATFSLMIELSGNAAANSLGLYNANDPSATPLLFQVFPGAAAAGWYATAHFGGGNLSVALFDNFGSYQGSSLYNSVNPNAFGFYIQGPNGTFYSQDARNGGSAQVLTYAGTGRNFGDWWECFEEEGSSVPQLHAAGRTSVTDANDFVDAVLLCQSVVPTPARSQSWGSVKTGYR